VRALLRQLRALVLGETWTVPLGVALALAATAALGALAGAWFTRLGGFVLLGAVLVVLSAAVRERPQR
jgi:hypothetical protein